MLLDIADFQDRVAAKIEALGGMAVPKRSKTVTYNGAGISPQVRAVISAWTIDELGNQSRTITSVEDPAPPS